MHSAVSILKKIQVEFPNGKKAWGSGFSGNTKSEVITCAHVVFDEGQNAKHIRVNGNPAKLKKRFLDIDIAVLDTTETDTSTFRTDSLPEVGETIFFAGFPAGVRAPSLFSGIVSAIGSNLISNPSCEIVQINGMINSGNSGGPAMDAEGKVFGVVTAKFVPLLIEVDKLRDILKKIPQLPSEVGIGQVDFSKFVNLMVNALTTISGSLRLVQVGTGYVVPIKLLAAKKGP